jgi:hypothetical protein
LPYLGFPRLSAKSPLSTSKAAPDLNNMADTVKPRGAAYRQKRTFSHSVAAVSLSRWHKVRQVNRMLAGRQRSQPFNLIEQCQRRARVEPGTFCAPGSNVF